MTDGSQYSDSVISGMQMLYGEGFLSPGGPDEVGQLLSGIDPTGLRVLDIGSGLGGCAIKLVRDFGAAHVSGIDIEGDLVARAKAAVNTAGLQEQIDIILVEPGPLPLGDHLFDLVITKDVICHIPDKVAISADIFRVLKPGGVYLCADFFDASADNHTSDEGRTFYQDYVEGIGAYGLSFHFEPQSAYEQALIKAGFQLQEVRDHTAISADVAEKEKVLLMGDASDPIKAALGPDLFERRIAASDMRMKALSTRGLLHGHILAKKPS